MAACGDALSLPKGLTIRKRGASIETVTTNALEVKLLSAGGGAEVLQGSLKKGEFITLTSTEEAVETYYILKGTVLYANQPSALKLSAGDTVVTQGLSEATTFKAETDVEFLCFTTRPTFVELSQDYRELVRLAEDIEVKDGYTAGHSRRLRNLCNAVGERLGLPSHRLHLLNYGAYLHDVGKTEVPIDILRKPSKLTPEEWEVIKEHPTTGRKLLESTFMKEAALIVEQHHERLDGSGYPHGLKGDDILIEAAIIAVVDSYDTITTDRPYRKAANSEKALRELQDQAGTLYHPDVVEALVAVVRNGKVPEVS